MSSEATSEMSSEAASGMMTSPEQQELRAELRQRFLRFLLSKKDEAVQLELYDRTSVRAEAFNSMNLDCDGVLVRDLETPIGGISHVLLRFSDVVAMRFDSSQSAAEENG